MNEADLNAFNAMKNTIGDRIYKIDNIFTIAEINDYYKTPAK